MMKHFIIYFGVVLLIQFVFGLISAQLCFKNVLFGFFLYDQSYRKEYYLINILLLLAKFSIHKCKFGGNKPLFLILRAQIQQYLKTILGLKNKKAAKCVSICKHFHIFV